MYTATFTNNVVDPDKQASQALYIKLPTLSDWLKIEPLATTAACTYSSPSSLLQLKFKIQLVPQGPSPEVTLGIRWSISEGKHSFTLEPNNPEGWSQDDTGSINHISGRASISFAVKPGEGSSPDGILIVGTIDIDARSPVEVTFRRG